MQTIKVNSQEYRDFISRSMRVRKTVSGKVRQIIDAVAENGDAALVDFTRQFDRAKISVKDLRVTEREISASFQNVDSSLILAVKSAIENVSTFYRKQLPKDFRMKTSDGKILEERYVPVERVGIYVPAGQVPLVSTVYMCAIPAIVAGVKEIVLVSPPGPDGCINPFILATASMLNIREVYKVGGAQAVAGLALGTKTIRKVDMIVGPGNEYVTEAKRQVYGLVGIDMLAGPSEVVIVANRNNNPEYIRRDLEAQTEHRGGLGIVVLIDNGKANDNSLSKLSIPGAYLIPVKNAEEAKKVVNELAPEHLEVLIKSGRQFAKDIKNAGAIFIGESTPVALGDYVAGPSHVLPTATTARFSSGLSVHDFLKRIHYIEYSKRALTADAPTLQKIGGLENMNQHIASVMARFGRAADKEEQA
jgi:histidinol dehydrogenase